MTTTLATTSKRSSGRPALLLGVFLALAGLGVYIVQVMLARLSTPWYVPVVATLGALLIAASLWQRFTVWRLLALLFVGLLAAGEWFMLSMLRLPAYTGSVAVGQPLPAFATLKADGTPFTERDLAGTKDSVLVFFRGRW